MKILLHVTWSWVFFMSYAVILVGDKKADFFPNNNVTLCFLLKGISSSSWCLGIGCII